MTAFDVLPNNYVRVFFSLQNVGNAPGSPDCSVMIQPVDGYGNNLPGVGIGTLALAANMSPGRTGRTFINVLVSHDEASAVTSRSMISVSNC